MSFIIQLNLQPTNNSSQSTISLFIVPINKVVTKLNTQSHFHILLHIA